MRNTQWKKIKKSREARVSADMSNLEFVDAFAGPERNWTLLIGTCAEQTPSGNEIMITGVPGPPSAGCVPDGRGSSVPFSNTQLQGSS